MADHRAANAAHAVGVQVDLLVRRPGGAKQRVLNAYPQAYSAQDVDGFWHIWCPTVRGSLSGGQQDTRSAATAWEWASKLQAAALEGPTDG